MKYKTKPCEIEAMIWNGKNKEEIIHFTNNHIKFEVEDNGKDLLFIETLEGTMVADIGDYIVKGLRGEFYSCKPDVFVKKYEQKKDVGEIIREEIKKNILVKNLRFGENFFTIGEKTVRICKNNCTIEIETYNTVSKSKYDENAELQATALRYTSNVAEISPELIANIAIISEAQRLVYSSTSEYLSI